MFDHVKFGCSDYAASKAFFLKALAPLGIVVGGEGEPSYGIELVHPKAQASLCLFQSHDKPAPLHIAFVAETREQVDAFHRAALEAGARDNGPPGLRPQYNARYYAAFVIAPDGHNIEAVYQQPTEHQAVRRTIDEYLRGHAQASADAMRNAFLPTAHIEGNRQGVFTSWSLDHYCGLFTGAVAADEATRVRSIDWIDVDGDAAAAKATLVHGAITFTDYFVLLKVDGQWKIANKVYHGRPSA